MMLPVCYLSSGPSGTGTLLGERRPHTSPVTGPTRVPMASGFSLLAPGVGESLFPSQDGQAHDPLETAASKETHLVPGSGDQGLHAECPECPVVQPPWDRDGHLCVLP